MPRCQRRQIIDHKKNDLPEEEIVVDERRQRDGQREVSALAVNDEFFQSQQHKGYHQHCIVEMVKEQVRRII